jgi:GTP cyclohydrolase FolE2
MNNQGLSAITNRIVLPVHERQRAGFDETFELSAHDTIEAMNRNGRDIASQKPGFLLPLKKMGVTRTGVPVRISDPLGGGNLVQLSCEVAMHVSLGDDRRGIHVSRLGNTIADHTGDVYQSLPDYACSVAENICRVQHADTATVSVSGIFAFLEPLQGIKNKVSLESLELAGSASCTADGTVQSSGITFNHITACPCVQETFRHSHGSQSDELMAEISRREMPLLTHSQRCRTQITISGGSQLPDLAKLLDVIDSVVVRCQNTMPREYELLTVYKAHHKPQFLEDVLREISAQLFRLLAGNPPQTRVSIKSVSMESIHDFDLDGEIDFTMADLQLLLRDK